MPSTEVATGGRRVVGKIVGEFDTVCLYEKKLIIVKIDDDCECIAELLPTDCRLCRCG